MFPDKANIYRLTLCLAFLLPCLPTSGMAADLNCVIPQLGELLIDTESGEVTKDADETMKAEIATTNSSYRFEFKGKINKFKAVINRASGQIILSNACAPECWGGPVYGTCTPVKAKF